MVSLEMLRCISQEILTHPFLKLQLNNEIHGDALWRDVLFKESKDWVSKRENALHMVYTGCQERAEMEWPRVPDGFDGWEPPRKNKKQGSEQCWL